MNTEETNGQTETISTVDEIAKRWYDTGFTFAVNYLIAWIPSFNSDQLDLDKFKELVRNVVGDEVIDDQYFEKLHYYQDNNNYGAMCPDPNNPSVCVPCTGRRVQPVPRP